jgi:hypothetical protein
MEEATGRPRHRWGMMYLKELDWINQAQESKI